MNDKNRIISVRELNLAARQLLEKGIPLLWVRGEISNFVCAASGHWYFSLKDEQAQVRCVMFRHKSQYLDWRPRNGALVEVQALATLYEARGDFQLTLEQMRPAGVGALYEAFDQLKRKLEAEGLFEEAGKRALPFLPRQIGVITSPMGAAVRDVLTTLMQRMPGIPVLLYPVPVQGEGAAQKIAQAIHQANKRAECDVLVVCRGGGSIEDLWAFNEESLARAIAESEIPIVSGVGHETDFTIADFVADARAATPTAAAQLVVPERGELMRRLDQQQQFMRRGYIRNLERLMQKLDFLQRRLIHPAERAQQQLVHLLHLQQRMQNAWAYSGQHRHWRWLALQQRLQAMRPDLAKMKLRHTELGRGLVMEMRRRLLNQEIRLQALGQHLTHLDPSQVLARGYSMVRDEHGDIVMDAETLPMGATLDITFARGWARAELKEKGGAG